MLLLRDLLLLLLLLAQQVHLLPQPGLQQQVWAMTGGKKIWGEGKERRGQWEERKN